MNKDKEAKKRAAMGEEDKNVDPKTGIVLTVAMVLAILLIIAYFVTIESPHRSRTF
jgi:uncharacterized membrane protein YvbJ